MANVLETERSGSWLYLSYWGHRKPNLKAR